MSDSPAGGDLREIRVLHFPLDVYQRSTEAFEGLRREFALVALRTPEAQEVPARLLQLIDALTDDYQGLNDDAEQLRDAAIAQGAEVVGELVYQLPAAAAGACIALNDMLDEADEFCRQGGVLLSLESPPEAVAFRRWYLGEVVAQLNGEPPLPWTEVEVDALLRNPRLRGTADNES